MNSKLNHTILLGAILFSFVGCSSVDYAKKQTDNIYSAFVENNDKNHQLYPGQANLNQSRPNGFYGNDYGAGKTFELEQIKPQSGMVLVANPGAGVSNPFVPVGYAEPKGAVGSTAGGPFGSLYGYNNDATGVNLAFVNQERGPAARALQPRILQGSQYALAGPVIGSSFNAVLQTEYERAAQNFIDRYRHELNGRYFRNKAMYAQQGRAVLPDDPDNWELIPENRRELWRARYALLQALEFGGRDLAPEQSAFTQANYDCWLAEIEIDQQDIYNHPCGQNFVWAFQDMRKIVAQRRQPDTLPANLYPQYAYLEQVIPPAAPPAGIGYPPSYQAPAKTIVYNQADGDGNNNQAPSLKPNAVSQKPAHSYDDDEYLELADNNPIANTPTGKGTVFKVYFEFGKSNLDNNATKILNNVIKYAKSAAVIRIQEDSYADRAGTIKANKIVSTRRANTVADYLTKHGISRKIINIIAHGEFNLPHPTKDGVRDARNRVVIITVY